MTNKPTYTPLGETAHTIHIATMAMIFTLEASKRADLTAPLADILKALSQLDYKGLEEVDYRNGVISRRALRRSGDG